MQTHILDSYILNGGYGKKWASDVQVGEPDLIVSMPEFGGHLVEVKHRPEWRTGIEYKNPMRIKQRIEARKYNDADMPVFLAIVTGENVKDSTLYYVSPSLDMLNLNDWCSVPWRGKEKFNIGFLLSNYIRS